MLGRFQALGDAHAEVLAQALPGGPEGVGTAPDRACIRTLGLSLATHFNKSQMPHMAPVHAVKRTSQTNSGRTDVAGRAIGSAVRPVSLANRSAKEEAGGGCHRLSRIGRGDVLVGVRSGPGGTGPNFMFTRCIECTRRAKGPADFERLAITSYAGLSSAADIPRR